MHFAIRVMITQEKKLTEECRNIKFILKLRLQLGLKVQHWGNYASLCLSLCKLPEQSCSSVEMKSEEKNEMHIF